MNFCPFFFARLHRAFVADVTAIVKFMKEIMVHNERLLVDKKRKGFFCFFLLFDI